MTDASTAEPSFSDFQLHPDIARAITAGGYTTPTPIQAKALPTVIEGRDVMGAAQTGTGKTAAFTLPILHRLMPQASHSASPARHPVRALILTPTRELADQVAENVKRYAKFTPLRSAVVFGGVDIHPQIEALRQGVEVLIATPGRLLDHMQQKSVNLSQTSILVLDEADRMLDMGFLPDLQRIINALPTPRQTLLFSATFSPEIRKLAKSYLVHPVEIDVAQRNATAENVRQSVYKLTASDKRAAVAHIVKSLERKQVICFTNTKIGTARLARELVRDGIKAESIHGDKTQGDRMKALEAFKRGELEVLVATDVAARGLDIAGVPCVINFDLPYNAEDYVHRIGRTGRAGASGDAISLAAPEDERLLADIEKLIKRTLPRETLPGFQPEAGAGAAGAGRRRRERDGDAYAEPHHAAGHRAPRYESNARGHHRQVVDDFFSKPYEATAEQEAAAAAEAEPQAVQPATRGPKRQLAALLGGAKKPAE
jgi:ATP-dependent RNA helicase RhlE